MYIRWKSSADPDVRPWQVSKSYYSSVPQPVDSQVSPSPSRYAPILHFDDARVLEFHALYAHAWWSRERTLDEARRVLAYSDFVFAYAETATDSLVAFARVLSDRTFNAVIFDVIVHPDHRGSGLGRLLIQDITTHPELSQVKHFELYCLPDLIPFYRNLGFSEDIGGVLLMRRKRT